MDAVLGFFYRRTACPHTAADLAAETFAQAFTSRRRFRDTGAPARAWLFGIARHLLSHAQRRRGTATRARRRLGVERIALDDESIARIEELADLEPVREALAAAVASLSDRVAEAVVLRVAHDLPYDEVARRLGCSEGAARVRVTRGLSQLADALEGGAA